MGKRTLCKGYSERNMFLVYGGGCCVKWFTTGSRNSLKDIWKLQMMPNHVALLRLWQKQLCSGWKSWLSWQEDNDRQWGNCTRVLPWFSMQHNAW
jgi:hypothetical protein